MKKVAVVYWSGTGNTLAMANEIADELKNMDVTTYTPIEAMNKLYELANRAKEI